MPAWRAGVFAARFCDVQMRRRESRLTAKNLPSSIGHLRTACGISLGKLVGDQLADMVRKSGSSSLRHCAD